MYGAEFFDFSYWWVFPLVMIVLCVLMMRVRRGSMMCGFGPWVSGRDRSWTQGSAKLILDKRYASGEIDRAEYEEKKKVLESE